MRPIALVTAGAMLVTGCSTSAVQTPREPANFAGSYSSAQPIDAVVERLVTMANTCWTEGNGERAATKIEIAEGHGVTTVIQRPKTQGVRDTLRRLDIREVGEGVEIRAYMRSAEMRAQAALIPEWTEGGKRCGGAEVG